MIYNKIYLRENDPDVFLEVIAPDKVGGYKRKALLVIPGGGYGTVCSDREGEPIALAFLPYGFASFVLHYSVNGKRFYPEQLIEASLAIKHIKDNAEEYGIDPEKVFTVGFSAGGHLSGSIATMWHKKEVYDAVDMPYGYNKPAGSMLIYPVISGIKEFSHIGSFRNLLGEDNPGAERKIEVSIEENVDEKTAPMFIMHTSNDQVVNIRHSLCLADALAKNKREFELHVYPDAPHGVALGNDITKCGNEKYSQETIAKWVEAAAMWAEKI